MFELLNDAIIAFNDYILNYTREVSLYNAETFKQYGLLCSNFHLLSQYINQINSIVYVIKSLKLNTNANNFMVEYNKKVESIKSISKQICESLSASSTPTTANQDLLGKLNKIIDGQFELDISTFGGLTGGQDDLRDQSQSPEQSQEQSQTQDSALAKIDEKIIKGGFEKAIIVNKGGSDYVVGDDVAFSIKGKMIALKIFGDKDRSTQEYIRFINKYFPAFYGEKSTKNLNSEIKRLQKRLKLSMINYVKILLIEFVVVDRADVDKIIKKYNSTNNNLNNLNNNNININDEKYKSKIDKIKLIDFKEQNNNNVKNLIKKMIGLEYEVSKYAQKIEKFIVRD